MNKTISVAYVRQSGEESCTLVVTYKIEKEGNVSLISCSVNQEASAPQWLHMKKFEVKTVQQGNSYSQLFNEKNDAANLDTSMFIDKTFGAIMQQEKMKLV